MGTVSPEVAYLRARYDEEAEYARRTAAEELDSLPTIQCQCGRRIHLGAPPRQLADVEAKRKILDLAPTAAVAAALLQPYADRDDFDPIWRT